MHAIMPQVFLLFTKFKEETVAKNYEFGKQLTAMRNTLGWSRPQLAERLGVTPNEVKEWERRVYPNHTSLKKIIELFVKEGVIPSGYMGIPRIYELWAEASQVLPLSERWVYLLLGLDSADWEPPVKQFSHWMILLVERTGLKPKQVASHVPNVYEWTRGRTYPDPERLKAAIEFFFNQGGFEEGFEGNEIEALWDAAYPSRSSGMAPRSRQRREQRQKVEIDRQWLSQLLSSKPPTSEGA